MLTFIEEEKSSTQQGTNIPKRRRGKPSDYRPEFADRACDMALLGFTNEKIASLLDVPYDTFNDWIARHPELAEKLSEGRDKADTEVVKGLYRRACGFEVKTTRREVTRIRKVIDGKEQPVEIHEKIIETTTYYPPESGAAQRWLQLRQPEDWRDIGDERPLRISDLLAIADAAAAQERRYIDAFAEHEPATDADASAGEDGSAAVNGRSDCLA